MLQSPWSWELGCSILGSWASPPPLQVPTISARAEMTFPSVVKDLLMFAPSWWRDQKPRSSGPVSEQR